MSLENPQRPQRPAPTFGVSPLAGFMATEPVTVYAMLLL